MHIEEITLSNAIHAAERVFSMLHSKTMLAAGALFGFVDAYVFQGEYRLTAIIFFAVIIDTILGIILAWHRHAITSRQLWRAVPKMFVYLLMYAGAVLLDQTLPESFRFAGGFTAFFIVSTEVISIFENAGQLGYQTPKLIIERLRVIREEGFDKHAHTTKSTRNSTSDTSHP